MDTVREGPTVTVTGLTVQHVEIISEALVTLRRRHWWSYSSKDSSDEERRVAKHKITLIDQLLSPELRDA